MGEEQKPLTASGKRNHADGMGNKIPPERIVRAEELFAGTGAEGVPFATRKIQNKLCEEFGVSPRQARVYIQLARQNLARLAHNNGKDPDALLERAEAMMLEAFDTARRKGDASSMVQASQRLAEIRGVSKGTAVNITANVGLSEALASVFTEVGAREASKPKDAG